MKIENNPLNPLSSSRQTDESRPVDSKRSVSNSSSIGSKDKAQLSSPARTLLKARTAFNAAPEVRAEQVETIRRQISEGQYEFNADELARKMLPKQKK
jgi:flagellar biosynthesis anti-sigma factor FlgM